MAELDQGTTVAVGTCPQCGGRRAYRVTVKRRSVMAVCRNVYGSGPYEGIACNSYDKPGGVGSQRMIRAFLDNGAPIDLDNPTPTKEQTNDDTQTEDRTADRDDSGDDDSGGWSFLSPR